MLLVHATERIGKKIAYSSTMGIEPFPKLWITRDNQTEGSGILGLPLPFG